MSFVILNEPDEKRSHLIGVVLTGILQRLLAHSFKPSSIKLTNLQKILNVIEEVGVVDQSQLGQYHTHLIGMFQRDTLPYSDLLPILSGVLSHEQSIKEQIESLRESIASLFGCTENTNEGTMRSVCQDHMTLLFTENLVENVSVMDYVVPLIQFILQSMTQSITQEKKPSLSDSEFCDCGMVILLRKLYYEFSHGNQESLSMLFSTIHSILAVDSSPHLVYTYLIGIHECFSYVEDSSDVMNVLKQEVVFILSIITQQSLPLYISYSV